MAREEESEHIDFEESITMGPPRDEDLDQEASNEMHRSRSSLTLTNESSHANSSEDNIPPIQERSRSDSRLVHHPRPTTTRRVSYSLIQQDEREVVHDLPYQIEIPIFYLMEHSRDEFHGGNQGYERQRSRRTIAQFLDAALEVVDGSPLLRPISQDTEANFALAPRTQRPSRQNGNVAMFDRHLK